MRRVWRSVNTGGARAGRHVTVWSCPDYTRLLRTEKRFNRLAHRGKLQPNDFNFQYSVCACCTARLVGISKVMGTQ